MFQKIKFLFSLFSLFVILILPKHAFSQTEQSAQIAPLAPAASHINQLILSSASIVLEDQGSITLEGQYTRKKWSLLVEFENQPLYLSPEGVFSRRITLTGPDTPFTLIAIGPNAVIERQTIHILSHRLERVVNRLNPASRWFFYSASLGISSLNYSDQFIKYSEYGITPKITLYYRLPNANRWRVIGNAYGTAIPFSASSYSIESVTVRYFGMNLKAGYETGWLPPTWSLEIQSGWYYSTMSVTHKDFGFTDANGPQVYPVLEKTFAAGNSLGTFFKFSPISSTFSVLSPTKNYEIATGVYYVFPPAPKLPFRYSASFDFSSLKLESNGIQSAISSYTLGLGASF